MDPARTSARVAAVRGAITVADNTATAIREATSRLLQTLVERNGLTPDRIVSAVFTATPDLNADFPAHAAQLLGWRDVPLLGAQELAVPGALARVVRVLLTVNDVPAGGPLVPAYLDGAAALRPDLVPERAGATAAARRVAIVGLGQIGGSIGLALGKHGGYRRVGTDADAAVRAAALAAGAIDVAAESIEEACRDAELAVLATPVDTLPEVIGRAARSLPRGAALLDTGSARAPLAEPLAAAARLGIAAVGGHPIAGTEGRGFPSARAALFAGATFALSPVTGAVPEIVTQLVAAVGARPVEVAPGPHDAALARTSHLPYLMACALRDLGADAAAAGLSGPAFRDMTRVAAADPRVAGAYCRANASEIEAAWRQLRDRIDRAVTSLEG